MGSFGPNCDKLAENHKDKLVNYNIQIYILCCKKYNNHFVRFASGAGQPVVKITMIFEQMGY